MRMGLGLGLTAAQSSGGSVDPDAAIAAILSDGAHMALDTALLSAMWTTTVRDVQVSAAGDFIGSIDSRFGTLTRTWQNGTEANCPTWNASGFASADGTTDVWGGGTNANSIMRNTPAGYFCMTFFPTSLGATGGLFAAGTATSNVSRFMVQTLSNGSISLQLRRLDADTLNTFTSAAGIIIPGNYYIVEADCDYAGTGAARLWVNGELVASGTIAGTPGNTSDTDSVRCRFFQSVASAGGYSAGLGRRPVVARKLLTDEERATVRNWSAGLVSEGGATRIGAGARTFFSSPDMAVDDDGNLIVTTAQDDATTSRHLWWNPTERKASVSAVTPVTAGDDHDHGSIIQLADGTWLSAAVGHNVPSLYIGLGPTPYDLTFTDIDSQLLSDDYSYTYLAQLEGVTGDPIILIGRTGEAGAWRIRMSTSLDGGVTWGTYTSFLISNAGDDRPYIQVAKNADGTRLYFSATDGLPSEFDPNSVYSGWTDGTAFYKTEDDSVVVTTGGVAPSVFSLAFDATAENDCWNWDMEIIGTDLVLAIATFPTVDNHRYRRLVMPLATGVWSDEIVVSDAGGLLITPSNYSGGVCFHPTNKDIMYASISDPAVESGVHQLYRMDRVSSGNWSRTQLTSGSVPSFRPEAFGNYLTFVRGVYGPTYFDFAGCYIMGMTI